MAFSKWNLAAAAALSFLFAGLSLAQTPSPALLVIEKDTQNVDIIDPASLQIVGRVPVGADPHEICVSGDGRTAYISDYGAFGTPLHMLSVIDLVAQKPLPPVELGALLAPHGMQTFDGQIYFTAEGSKAIGRYDPERGEVAWILGVGENRTHMLVVSPDGDHIFTSNVNSDTISVFDHVSDHNAADASGWRQTRIAVGKGPEGFDVSPDGKELWAANSHEGTVSIIDVGDRRVVQTIDVRMKMANRLKFTRDGKLVLMSDLDTGDLVMLDALSRKEIKRISLGHGAAGILITPDGSRAFVAVSRDSYVAVVDLKTLSVAGRIATGGGPDGMAWAVRSVSQRAADKESASASAITNLPATFIGTLPCADCPGIDYQINLLIDHTFVSRMTYEERNTSFDEQGSWDSSKDDKMLVLKPAHGRLQKFLLPDADTLRQLDADGHEIQSKFNYDLKRAGRFAPMEDQRNDSGK